MGKRGKGRRSDNREALLSFITENRLCLTNAHFRRRDRQTATWRKATQLRKAGKSKGSGVYSQIDYIVAPRRVIKLFNDAKAMEPTRRRADHSMVIGAATLKQTHKTKRMQRRVEVTRDLRTLTKAETAENVKQR